MKERDFDKLVSSVKQAGGIKRGKIKPGRTYQMVPADVRSIRKKLDNSQSQFVAKAYQVVQVLLAVARLEEQDGDQ